MEVIETPEPIRDEFCPLEPLLLTLVVPAPPAPTVAVYTSLGIKDVGS
jgi:hypothetical protein